GGVGHLGLAVHDVVPADAEPGGQLGSKASGVEDGDGALVVLEGPGVEGEPPPVGGYDSVRNHEVGVDLRVVRPAGVLAESGTYQAPGVDGPDLAINAVPAMRVVLDPPESSCDRGVVCFEDLVADPVAADGEQDRNRLRG